MRTWCEAKGRERIPGKESRTGLRIGKGREEGRGVLCLLGRVLARLNLAEILALVWLERGWSGKWLGPTNHRPRGLPSHGREAGHHVPLNNQLSPGQPQLTKGVATGEQEDMDDGLS